MLYCEDMPSDVTLTEALFERERIRNPMRVVEDIPQALNYLFQSNEPLPALVLLDLSLRGGDGLEILRAMRADPTTAHIPVVVLTVSEAQADTIRAFRFGASAFLHKPLDMAKLAQAVRTLGLGWEIVPRES